MLFVIFCTYDIISKLSKKNLRVNVAFCSDIFSFLYQPGCRVDAPTVENQTALHLAASEGYSVMCEILLDFGACVNAKDNDNDTPLHITLAKETIFKGTIGQLVS